ncbi:MAG: arginine--tRNA ligase [Syntrophomonadaceae bacterium]|nr:arginine--tRNA ligase [Syntrophomonadaceae bacterium]
MNFIESIKTRLRNLIDQSLRNLTDKGELKCSAIPPYVIEVPREKNHGDFAVNVAMLMAREAGMAPRKIAEMIVAGLPADDSLVSRVEIAGAGFINFYLDNRWLYQVPYAIIQQGDDYGRADKNGIKVQVEFVSANPTGDLHMGNARGGAIGDTLANILDAAGYEVEKEFYVNDSGNQIELFGLSLEARYLELLGEPFDMPESGYAGQDVVDTVKEALEEYGDRWLALKPAERRLKLINFALERRLEYIKKTLSRFGIEYDVWFKESSLYNSNAVDEVIQRLFEMGYIYENEGARWFKSTLFGDEKDEVVVRNNGIPTYFAADIAYHLNKFQRGFDWVINVWGADHHGHVARMKGAISALGYDPDRLDVIIMQLVRLYRSGEIVRMSKRTGTLVTLDELIEEVGKDAARFFFVQRSPDSHLDFDLELAKKESQDNPVYYAQYAHARICSILRQAKAQGISVPPALSNELEVLVEEEELDLLRRLADFPEEVRLAADNMAPQRIPHFVLDLAGLLHSFYNHHRVLGENTELRDARLALMEAVRITVNNALTMLGVSAPERM